MRLEEVVTQLTCGKVHACMSFGTNSKDECILGAWASIHAWQPIL